ncbi:MAG: bifunctional 4-hydroxy-2-oxoglutarate aldolase/2-dehydro-3-deoxy-phosphogluconate aldolase [Spirochaetia bacterium]|nr:bifunctional 4-hydroxy-2-oxoglutarate aldolase/2-dehydro-3-deoxy-phosphogluconate aldolase [Spirochaetia bacterium]
MYKVMNSEIKTLIKNSGVVAVLEIEDSSCAVETARALIKGGVTVIELALRSAAAVPSIALIKEHVREMNIGVGTILHPDQIQHVMELGALFGVSPGLNEKVVESAILHKFPFAPGVATASEIEKAVTYGCDVLKLFPATPLGGIEYLKAVSAPYKHLNLSYFPLGGITLESLPRWAKVENVLTVGGSWIATKDLIREHNYDEITRRAKIAMDIWNKERGVVK